VDNRHAAALKAGGKSLFEPMDTPGVGRMGGIIDPQGGNVTFITYAQ
jgi:hypothetical protein